MQAHSDDLTSTLRLEPVAVGEGSGISGLLDVRAAFEWWFSDEGSHPKAVQRSGDGYKLATAQFSWLAWQAAWSAREAA